MLPGNAQGRSEGAEENEQRGQTRWEFSVFLDSNHTSIAEVVAAFEPRETSSAGSVAVSKQRRLCDRDTCLRVVVADRIVGERLHRLRGETAVPFGAMNLSASAWHSETIIGHCQ